MSSSLFSLLFSYHRRTPAQNVSQKKRKKHETNGGKDRHKLETRRNEMKHSIVTHLYIVRIRARPQSQGGGRRSVRCGIRGCTHDGSNTFLTSQKEKGLFGSVPNTTAPTGERGHRAASVSVMSSDLWRAPAGGVIGVIAVWRALFG